jgi:serine/threonine protein kinase
VSSEASDGLGETKPIGSEHSAEETGDYSSTHSVKIDDENVGPAGITLDYSVPRRADTAESGVQDVQAGSRYSRIREHAKGGLGLVFLAQDHELQREVALKEIQPQFVRFLLEAKLTGRLEHPGIVPVYGLGQYPDGRPYYAMRFIQGESFQEEIEAFHRENPIENSSLFDSRDFRGLIRRFIDVCNAIHYAHEKGVIHRDIKPANVMLGKYGETLVVDWGLAKLLYEPRASPGKQ